MDGAKPTQNRKIAFDEQPRDRQARDSQNLGVACDPVYPVPARAKQRDGPQDNRDHGKTHMQLDLKRCGQKRIKTHLETSLFGVTSCGRGVA